MARRPTRNDQYVFISYRREDSQTITGRIYDWLSHCTQSEKIFMDIDSIELGVNFVERITESIPKCRAMLVVIGPDWLDEAGQPSHYVRLEIEKALDCRIQIIPLLVEGASLPPAADLPEGIRPLVSLNAATVRAGRDFPHDMQDVTRSLGLPDRSIAPSEGRTRPSPQVTRRFVLTATGAIGLTALGVGIQRWLTSPESSLPYLPRAVLYLFEATSASLYAVNVSDGSTRWSYSLGAELTGFAPLNIGTTVFMGTSEGILYAFDGDQGSVRWQQSVPGSRVNGAFGSRGAVYVNAGPRAGSARVLPTVYALSAGDGAVRWQVSCPGTSVKLMSRDMCHQPPRHMQDH